MKSSHSPVTNLALSAKSLQLPRSPSRRSRQRSGSAVSIETIRLDQSPKRSSAISHPSVVDLNSDRWSLYSDQSLVSMYTTGHVSGLDAIGSVGQPNLKNKKKRRRKKKRPRKGCRDICKRILTIDCMGFSLFVILTCGIIGPIHMALVNTETTLAPNATTTTTESGEVENKSEICDPGMIGDGYCNDTLNVPECFFDLGDCCRSRVKKRDCKDCVCKKNNKVYMDEDQSYRGNWTLELEAFDCIISWIGNKICERENNIKQCHYDGGDCCLHSKSSIEKCNNCQCKHTEDDKSVCLGDFANLGNKKCDQEFSYPACYYDGGDC